MHFKRLNVNGSQEKPSSNLAGCPLTLDVEVPPGVVEGRPGDHLTGPLAGTRDGDRAQFPSWTGRGGDGQSTMMMTYNYSGITVVLATSNKHAVSKTSHSTYIFDLSHPTAVRSKLLFLLDVFVRTLKCIFTLVAICQRDRERQRERERESQDMASEV